LTLNSFRGFVAASFPLHVLLHRDIERDFNRLAIGSGKPALELEGFYCFISTLIQESSKYERDVWHCLRMYHFKETDLIARATRTASVECFTMDPESNILLCFQQLVAFDKQMFMKLLTES